jgi:hypothetical protein
MKKADNFNPGKWLVENKITFQSRLNENQINNKYVVKDDELSDKYGDFYTIDTDKALDYLKQFNNEDVDAEVFIDDDEGWGEFVQYIDDVEQMSDTQLEDEMRTEMSIYFFSDPDTLNESRLNEMNMSDTFKVEELANEELSNYISKNNLGSVKNISRLMNVSHGEQEEGRKLIFKITFSTGEILYFETIYGPDLNLISIEQVGNPYDFPDKNPRKTKSKIPGITLKVDKSSGEVNMSSRSGDYDGFIEDDGTISFSVVVDDNMDEEFNDDNWKDILGNNHAFVKIANTIPTEVEALDDYVQITIKASDLM